MGMPLLDPRIIKSIDENLTRPRVLKEKSSCRENPDQEMGF
jgi:hypothetical protein